MATTTFRHIAPAVPAVKQLLKTLKTSDNQECLEFEARIGTRTSDGKFQAGVDRAFAARVLCKLETANCWTHVSEWTEQVDRFYTLSPSGTNVRTSTIAGIDPASGHPTTTIVHITKAELGHVDAAWLPATTSAASASSSDTGIVAARGGMHVRDFVLDGGSHEVRISVKHELPVPESTLPPRVDVDAMHLVRIKQRKSFVYVSATGGAWSYDVTLVYAAATYAAALELVRLGTSTLYEVEIECVRPASQIDTRSEHQLAVSMLLKVADLFERDDVDALPIAQCGFELRPS